jgi:hypothetical protein
MTEPSWANAYTSLQTALQNTTSGEIWVAQGTYVPAGADSSATHLVAGAVELYGGFDGTESTLIERDVEQNVTILSGDVNGDDVQGDFSLNKTDNVQHVVVVDSLIGATVVIDGFTIQGGHTSDFSDQEEFFWRGGGIFAYSAIEVNQCTFVNNFGRSGACVYISSAANGGDDSSFRDCTFSFNNSTSQSAGIYAFGIDGLDVQSCTFSENATTRGALYPNSCSSVTIDDCLFEDNTTLSFGAFGGAFFSWQSTGVSITFSTFRNNTAGNGGVLYHDNREVPEVDPLNFVIENCIFEGNTAQEWGGGSIYTFDASITLNNCDFDGNTAANSGGHVFFGGSDKEVVITNCTFSNGLANFGAAHNCYGENSFYTLSNNTYQFNEAATSGTVINGFKANVTIEDCTFSENLANFGGAMYFQNDTTFVTIDGCTFTQNVANTGAGALNISSGASVILTNSTFTQNSGGDGGAVGAFEGGALEESYLTVENCIFNLNQASIQGGAFSIFDMDVGIINCLIANNFSPDGAGGGIIVNASDDDDCNVSLMNVTLANNASNTGANLAMWESDVNANSFMTLQNCLLSSAFGDNFAIEEGEPELTGTGGNVSADASLIDYLTDPTDQNLTGPDNLFLDEFNDDFHLNDLSPAIDAGVATGAPEFDLDGNARVNEVDAGCYEWQGPSSVDELVSDFAAQLHLYPNPVVHNAVVELENDWLGELEWQLVDVKSQISLSGTWEKFTERHLAHLQLSGLPTGAYFLQIRHAGQFGVVKVVKK